MKLVCPYCAGELLFDIRWGGSPVETVEIECLSCWANWDNRGILINAPTNNVEK